MHTVNVELASRSYVVHIGSGILGSSHPAISISPGSTALIICNETVAPLYLGMLENSLMGANVHSLILPDGESYKTMAYWSQIIDRLIEIGATRDSTLLTLGGGVIGDLGGFAAASYMRGIRFIQVPTTLLSQVDASVGGKTGFNHPQGKNLIGAFHQPASVLIDIATLASLPKREFAAGMAEVIKIAAIRDTDFLNWLEKHCAEIHQREPETLVKMIQYSVAIKAAIVAEDEREAGVRALLNFGHTFAHALESLSGYRDYLHGEAVAIGMVVASRLSEQRGLCQPGICERLKTIIRRFELPLSLPSQLLAKDYLDRMKLDKKSLADRIRLILIRAPGEGMIDGDSSLEQIEAAINDCKRLQHK